MDVIPIAAVVVFVMTTTILLNRQLRLQREALDILHDRILELEARDEDSHAAGCAESCNQHIH